MFLCMENWRWTKIKVTLNAGRLKIYIPNLEYFKPLEILSNIYVDIFFPYINYVSS